MSVFEYLQKYYEYRWSSPEFKYEITLILGLVFLNSAILALIMRVRRNLSDAPIVFMPIMMIFTFLSMPMGFDMFVGVLAICASFVSITIYEAQMAAIRRIEEEMFIHDLKEISLMMWKKPLWRCD